MKIVPDPEPVRSCQEECDFLNESGLNEHPTGLDTACCLNCVLFVFVVLGVVGVVMCAEIFMTPIHMGQCSVYLKPGGGKVTCSNVRGGTVCVCSCDMWINVIGVGAGNFPVNHCSECHPQKDVFTISLYNIENAIAASY